MILATYQSERYLDHKDRWYGNIKELIGAKKDRPIYWCFPANSLEQFLIGTRFAHPAVPQKLVMFETDEYTAIDGIKWTAASGRCENEDDAIVDKGLLDIAHPGYVLYIVKDIPDDRIEVDADITLLVNKYRAGGYGRLTREALSSCMKYISDLHAGPVYQGIHFAMDTGVKMTMSGTEQDFSKEMEKVHKEFRMFASYAAPRIYNAAMEAFGYDTSSVHMDPGFLMTAANVCRSFNTASLESDDEETLEKQYASAVKQLRDQLFPDKVKIYPNDPCPCGSGIKYKNCCSRKSDESIAVMSEKFPVYRKTGHRYSDDGKTDIR